MGYRVIIILQGPIQTFDPVRVSELLYAHNVHWQKGEENLCSYSGGVQIENNLFLEIDLAADQPVFKQIADNLRALLTSGSL